MTASMVLPAKSGRRVLGKILQRLARGSAETTKIEQKSNLNISRLKRRVWTMKDTAPAVAAASASEAPVLKGDWVYQINDDTVHICSVAPTSAVAASFIKMHA